METTQFSLCVKACQSGSNIKVVMIEFFYLDGIVQAEFVPRNATVNSEHYKGLLQRLRNDVRRKWREKWANSLILHHDNAPCHTSLLVQQILSNKNITVCLIHLIHWIWHHATSGSSPKSKWPWKVNVLNQFRTLRQPRQPNLRHSRKRISRTASESSKNNGISVFEVRGSILRGINGNVSFTVTIFFI